MLRAGVALLLLANLLFFGWARGWFAPGWPPPHIGEREPERLAAQVRPASVTVLPPVAASAAVSAARAAAAACLEAGPIADAEVGAAEAALAAAQMPEGSWVREPAAPPPLWLLYAGRVTDAATRRTREEELRKLKLTFEVITAPADLAPGLVLSRHSSRAAAEAALAQLAAPAQPGAAALRGVRVVALPAPAALHWLRVPRADAEQQVLLLALPSSAALAGGFKACSAHS